ncbi:carbohydrate kinase family protein [Sphingobacterium pedocola]|uniref:Carbohydrate kinase family protein n=1 Tax=Sphingobacterium pedocola TaxID=2082722 RepID=A0ABR9TD51_9SPHI|nr:carbohydrate kinase family protein [Sphingobacterium pedocola]MBE8723266.1 carbohydrate kinase family protein [Sphingobacterium pedocola]
MGKIVVVGELNVDLILDGLSHLPVKGKEILANAMSLTLGSSSAIFANNLSVLGSDVAFVGKVGEDLFGDLVMSRLRRSGVDTQAVVRDRDRQTGATVAISFGNERAMVTYPGVMDTFGMNDINWDLLAEARHLHVSSIFLQPRLKRDLVSLLHKAKSLGMTTSLDVQWDPNERWDLPIREVLPLVDLFLPNEVELLALTGCGAVERAMNKLSRFANVVVVKLGQKGCLAMENGVFTDVPSFMNENVVDAIGAGDSFNAGFIHYFLQGHSVERSQMYGNLIGAISTTSAGGTGAFTSREDVMEIARTKFNFSYDDVER